jgi:long-chain acyl-CoA synthetase
MKSKKPFFYEVTKFGSIREMLDIAKNDAGGNVAFKYKTGEDVVSVTYSEFVDQTEHLGSALTELGYGSSHIACIGPNSYKWVLTYLTVLKSAGVFVPIDKELPVPDILNIVNRGDCEVVFCSRKYADIFKVNADKIPGVKLFVCFDLAEDVSDGDFSIRSFDRLIEYGRTLDSGKYRSLKSDPNALKMLVYTSGTTGNSKGVMLSEHNLVSSVYYGLQVSTVYDTCLSVLPYHHTYEAVSGLLVSLHKHATICINDSFASTVKNLKLYKPSYIYLVPAFVEVFYANILKMSTKAARQSSSGCLFTSATVCAK